MTNKYCLLLMIGFLYLKQLHAQLAQAAPLAGQYLCLDVARQLIFKLEIKEDYCFEMRLAQLHSCTPNSGYYGQGQVVALTDSTITLSFDRLPLEKSSYHLQKDSLKLALSILKEYQQNRKVAQKKLEHLHTSPQITITTSNKEASIHLYAAAIKPNRQRRRNLSQEFQGYLNLQLKPKERLDYLRIEQAGQFNIVVNVEELEQADYQLQLYFRPKPKQRADAYVTDVVHTYKRQATRIPPLKASDVIILQEFGNWYESELIVLEKQ